MWTIGRSQCVEEKKYRPIVRKIRYCRKYFFNILVHEFDLFYFTFQLTPLNIDTICHDGKSKTVSIK